MTRTITNSKTGQQIETKQTDLLAAVQFAQTVSPDSWLWYWIHKTLEDQNKHADQSKGTRFLSHLMLYAIGRGLEKPKHTNNKRPKVKNKSRERSYLKLKFRISKLCFAIEQVVFHCDQRDRSYRQSLNISHKTSTPQNARTGPHFRINSPDSSSTQGEK